MAQNWRNESPAVTARTVLDTQNENRDFQLHQPQQFFTRDKAQMPDDQMSLMQLAQMFAAQQQGQPLSALGQPTPQTVPNAGWGTMPVSQPMPINTYGANVLNDGNNLGYADRFGLEGNYRSRKPR